MREGVILCPGAAAGLDRDGRVQHIRGYHELQGFVGFVVKTMERGKTVIRCRGSVMLLIPGGDKREPGMPVYVVNPNEFTLKATTGGHAIGQILFVQPERLDLCCVVFKSFDDPRPLVQQVAGLEERGRRR